ncbi:hypothetical protein L211DRAFT_870674 [Terfezia boudieri ATCC MYA-4762]|uniref:F-box domain-containing protein n=1 Tax=Terfezia boudieri ATCC MYA-4762 TaxID=1051890 RepID=A0A3N4LC78_9PEZI|nr:hypothetical protein L211DRAFT_870674 [Terfezia boudieri ATCC MYA-4762]
MDTSLPSYQAATARDPLSLIAPYIRKEDLLRASLVCRRWHIVFSRALWTSPEVFWEMGDRNTLSTASFNSIEMGFYAIPEVHNTASPHVPPHNNSLHNNPQPVIPKGCHNLTAVGLEGFLRIGWPQLEVLDLSSSNGAAQAKPISAIANEALLPSLNKLVLGYLELQDGLVEILAKGLGTRITELDIRGNLVSDVGIQWLLNYCFLPPEYEVGDRIVLGQLNYAVPPPLPREHSGTVKRKGLTRIMVSKNSKVSWTAVENLIKTTRLESFDCGMIPDFDTLAANSRKRLPLPILSMYAHKNLHTLRIDFRIIAPMASKVERLPTTTPVGDAELYLKPTMLPNLRRLILCGVPYYTPASFRVMDDLKQFLDDLADAEVEAEIRDGKGKGGLRYLRLLVVGMQALSVTEDEEDGGVGMYASSSGGRPNRRNSVLDSVEEGDEDEDDGSADGDKDFSFFGDGEDEGVGEWVQKTQKVKVAKKKEKETQVNVLSELERYREQGRKGVGKFWRGEVRVVRDMGWDDQGGVELGSVGLEKWGVVEEKV